MQVVGARVRYRRNGDEMSELCIICFRGTAGGSSKWAWLACGDCRAVNVAIERRTGVRPFKLGRHSLMNGIGVRVGASAEVVDEQLAGLVRFARGDDRLRAWRDTEYPRLAAAFAPRVTVPLSVWQKRWPPGIDASWDALSRLLGLNRGLGVRGEPGEAIDG